MVTRQEKEEIVSSLKDKMQGATIAMVANYTGLSMEQLKTCRKSLKGVARCIVVKNTLAKIALEGAEIEAVGEYLSGPSLLVLGQDDPSLTIKEFNKCQKQFNVGDQMKLVLKGGVFPNESQTLNSEQLEAIGKLPPKEVLLAQIAGSLTATPAAIATTINQIIGGIGELAVKVAEKNNN